MAAINTDFESGLSGLRTAKAFANEDKELDKFDSANLSYRDSKADFYRAMGRFNAVMEFFMCILSAIVIAVGGALIMSEQLNIIDLITFSLYVRESGTKAFNDCGTDCEWNSQSAQICTTDADGGDAERRSGCDRTSGCKRQN